MDNALWEMAIAFLPPLVAAGITTLGLWFSERHKDRDEVQQRRKSLTEELTRVRYLRSWLKTYDMIPGTISDDVTNAREGVCRDLVGSHSRLSHSLQRRSGEAARSPGTRVLKRAILVPLARPGARALRWGYWFFLVLSVLFTLAFMTSGYETADGTVPSPLSVVASGFVMFILFFAPALVFRAWALWLERRHHAGDGGTLWHRLPEGEISVGIAMPPSAAQRPS